MCQRRIGISWQFYERRQWRRQQPLHWFAPSPRHFPAALRADWYASVQTLCDGSDIVVRTYIYEVSLPPIKVLLADDSTIIRRAIRRLLESHPQISLVGEACDFAQTILMTVELQPHIVVMDLHMPDGDSVIPEQFKAHPIFAASRILAISLWNDEETQALAASFGVVQLLDKANLSAELIPAILHFAMPQAGRQNPPGHSL
jgi:CheY-like chemotaxis protein